ncbi:MAG: FtsX-like permease family protein, partial [Chloroflexota bacterium]|nr:FtsX-like permease family protein [Chloroflexota bacterium]
TFAPVSIEVENPETGQPVPLKVIGVINSKISSLFGVYANQATVQQIFPKPVFTSYFTRLADSGQAEPTAKAIEAALLSNGVQSTSIRDELEDQQRQSSIFLYIIQGFMGLGLIVGIAAVGVIAFRSVVERRQQIGMLRALGYQRSLVSLSFLIETAFVVGLGVLSGTILGLWLARNLFTSEEFASAEAEFVIPWTIVLVILVVTVVAALLMTWIPARQASKLAPAEALRYE